MVKIYKHWCGCKTKKIKGVIFFDFMCKRHKTNGKYIWIAIQHNDAKEVKSE